MPCEYCNGEFKPLLDYDDGFSRLKAYIDGYSIEFLFDCDDDTYDCDEYVNVKYCPMCGRDLREVE